MTTSDKGVEKHFVLNGTVMLHQAGGRAHRAGLDAVMLAASISTEEIIEYRKKHDSPAYIVDLGAGVGTAGLCVAARIGEVDVMLVENDPTTLRLAKATLDDPDNAELAHRVKLLDADVTLRGKAREARGLTANIASHVIMNPPYWESGQVRLSPDETRAHAHVLGEGGLAPWFACAASILKTDGVLSIIMPSERLADVLKEFEGRFGAIKLFPLYKGVGEPASRIIIRAVKASRAPLQILPGLILHKAPEDEKSRREWTDEADAILKGEAALCI